MSKICAYCGSQAGTVDHVVPKALYPVSKRKSCLQLLTVPACEKCNQSYSDDEEHFRNVITTGGEITPITRELFFDKVRPSFAKGKSLRHFRQLVGMMKDYKADEEQRHIIYPMQDTRFVRILLKVYRGLAFHHFGCPVPEENIWTDVLKYSIPPGLLEGTVWNRYDTDIFEYWYGIYEYPERTYISFWILRFFGTRNFIGKIDMTDNMSYDKREAIKLEDM